MANTKHLDNAQTAAAHFPELPQYPSLDHAYKEVVANALIQIAKELHELNNRFRLEEE